MLGRRRPLRAYMVVRTRRDSPGNLGEKEERAVNDTTTPRPNAATGAFMGFVTMG